MFACILISSVNICGPTTKTQATDNNNKAQKLKIQVNFGCFSLEPRGGKVGSSVPPLAHKKQNDPVYDLRVEMFSLTHFGWADRLAHQA